MTADEIIDVWLGRGGRCGIVFPGDALPVLIVEIERLRAVNLGLQAIVTMRARLEAPLPLFWLGAEAEAVSG